MPDANANGHIELERRIDSIIVGSRHRKDPGDIETLMESIKELGLLQPITVTPDGVLVCGWRRLVAMRRLGWRTCNVWVRSGISDLLNRLLAQQDDNVLHKPYSQLEAAALYRELKLLMGEDAARREAAGQFTSTYQPRWNGSADSAEPLNEFQQTEMNGSAESAEPLGAALPYGDARAQAARTVTSTASYSRLEQIGRLQDIAADEDQPESVREMVAVELAQIDAGEPVDPAFQRVQAAIRFAADEKALFEAAELRRLAAEALERAKTAKRRRNPAKTDRGKPQSPTKHSLRSFRLTWRDLDGWTEHYDPAEIAEGLSDEEWESWERVVAETVAFAEAVRGSRASVAREAITA
jgi:ParB family chromosome partitioning protein